MSGYIDTRDGQRLSVAYDRLRKGDVIVTPERATVWIDRPVREESVPALPTEPGYYMAEQPEYGGPVVVELLNSPTGQWVDSGDRNYLNEDQVRALGSLVRLEPRPVTAKAVLDLLPWQRLESAANLDRQHVREKFGVES